MEVCLKTEQRQMNSAQEELIRFQIDTASQIAEWESQILDSTDEFFEVEKRIHEHFCNGSGKITAALLASTSQSEQVAAEVTKIQLFKVANIFYTQTVSLNKKNIAISLTL